MIKERIVWIDWARALGIFLVVYAHAAYGTSAQIIASFHMPFFFFLSGLMAKVDDWRASLRRDTQTLLVPYLIYSVAAYLVWLGGLGVGQFWGGPLPSVEETLIRPPMGVLLAVGYPTEWSTHLDPPVWFLVGLFLCKAALAQVVRVNKTWFTALTVVVAAGVAVLFQQLRFDLLWSVDSALLAFPFVVLGHHFRRPVLALAAAARPLVAGLVAVGLLAVVSFLALHNGVVDINKMSFGDHFAVFFLTASLGTALLIALAVALSRWSPRVVATISQGTLLILSVHWLLLGPVRGLFPTDLLPPRVVDLLTALVITALCVPLIHLAKNHLPVLIGQKARP